jgi:hypothetical protein
MKIDIQYLTEEWENLSLRAEKVQSEIEQAEVKK